MTAFLIFISDARLSVYPVALLRWCKHLRLQLITRMLARTIAFALVASIAWCQALEEAKRAFDKGDYGAAARLFEQAQEQSPRCEILFYLGLARYRLRQADAALIAFRSAVECDPKLLPAHLAMAEAYSERHNDSEALEAYERVLGLDPRNAEALSGAGNLYLKNQADGKAVELLKTLVALNDRDADAHAELAAALAAFGERQEPRSSFESPSSCGPITLPL